MRPNVVFFASLCNALERRQYMYGQPIAYEPPAYEPPMAYGPPVAYGPPPPPPPGYYYPPQPMYPRGECEEGQGAMVVSQLEQLSEQVGNVANDMFGVAQSSHSLLGLLTMPLQLVHTGLEAVQMVGSVANNVANLRCANQGTLSNALQVMGSLSSSYNKLKDSVSMISGFGSIVDQLSVFHDLMSGLEGLFSGVDSVLSGVMHIGHGASSSDAASSDPYAATGDPYAATGDPYAATGDPYAATGDPYAATSDAATKSKPHAGTADATANGPTPAPDTGWDTVYVTSTVSEHHSHTRTVVRVVTATGQSVSHSHASNVEHADHADHSNANHPGTHSGTHTERPGSHSGSHSMVHDKSR